MMRDYYKILGVSASASMSEIKRAYRRLARQHHPDVNVSGRDEHIKRLNEAYEMLSDVHKRAAYDELLREARQRAAEILAERERKHREEELQREAEREPEMTWMEGVFGFVRELRKGMRED